MAKPVFAAMHSHAIATKRTCRDGLKIVLFAAWPQQPERRWRIGTLISTAADDPMGQAPGTAFLHGVSMIRLGMALCLAP